MKNIEVLLDKLQAEGFILPETKEIALQEFSQRNIEISKSTGNLIFNIFKKGNPQRISRNTPIEQNGVDALADIILKNFSLSVPELDEIAMIMKIVFAYEK